MIFQRFIPIVIALFLVAVYLGKFPKTFSKIIIFIVMVGCFGFVGFFGYVSLLSFWQVNLSMGLLTIPVAALFLALGLISLKHFREVGLSAQQLEQLNGEKGKVYSVMTSLSMLIFFAGFLLMLLNDFFTHESTEMPVWRWIGLFALASFGTIGCLVSLIGKIKQSAKK